VTCNYYKKPGHMKTECHALKAKNGKFTHKCSLNEEVNFCGSSSTTLRSTTGGTPEDYPNILNVGRQKQEGGCNDLAGLAIKAGVF
jgi:hypothetical protein